MHTHTHTNCTETVLSTCLRSKHGTDILQGKFLNAYVQHTVDHCTQLIYFNPASFKTSDLSESYVSVMDIKVNQNQLMPMSCFSKRGASRVPYEDYVLHPVQPHQIIMQSKILNPQEALLGQIKVCFSRNS